MGVWARTLGGREAELLQVPCVVDYGAGVDPRADGDVALGVRIPRNGRWLGRFVPQGSAELLGSSRSSVGVGIGVTERSSAAASKGKGVCQESVISAQRGCF